MDLNAILQQLADFDTALLANTLGYMLPGTEHEWYMESTIASVTPSLGPTVGVAMTCEIDSSSPRNEANWDLFYEQ